MPTLPRPLSTALAAATALVALASAAVAAPSADAAPPVPRATRTLALPVADPAMDPILVDPLVWKPSAATKTFTAPADRDVLVNWPDRPLDVAGGFTLIGGRNVISTGGTVNFSKEYHVTGEAAKDNRCLYIAGNAKAQAARTIVLDGFHCAGSNVYEGINFDARAESSTITLKMRNILIDGVKAHLGASVGSHDGGDAFQAWNGPLNLEINRFTANNLDYQGFFLQPYAHGNATAMGKWTLSNVTLNGSRSGHAYLLWLAGTRNAAGYHGVAIDVRNVQLTAAPALGWKAVWKKEQWTDVRVNQS
ncbi:hypothetical protein [Kineococcus radiotolerans]|uniref:Uncharacterized protein n=1 Tax=Kineococcus radiotolerans (strain ATCC BAA-149 / DSM 14245 / SRS30216) TaxID=266940 RepID=A6WEA0_KINRD|nr:hypothetical protein [Kineococcus radiotolerans]ABS05139.1 hypothetical protein Krad_3676 [Kineococcus radiotolerans SRS30216 = ATCC BAA-149]